MLEIECYIKRINYNNILELVSPVFEKYHIPMIVGKAALFFMSDSQKQEILISLVKMNNSKILSALQDIIDKNNILLDLKRIIVKEGVNKMIEIKLLVDNINYESIAKLAMPMLSENLKKQEKMSFLNELLKNEEVSKNVVTAALNEIPDEMKNNLVLSAVKCYNNEISEALRNVLKDKGIGIDIAEISLRNTEY